MAFILLGAPGSGKGTQARNFVEQLSCTHLSTGDLLRKEISQETDLGKEAQNYMNSGKYVPDEMVFSILEKEVSGLLDPNKIVFDGFPRTMSQVDLLGKLLDKLGVKLERVFNIHLDDQVIVARTVNRLVCVNCGSVYNKITSAPLKEGVCDRCGTNLIVREDDKEDTVLRRLKTYHETVGPIIQYYKKNGCLVDIDGSLSWDKVWENITSHF
jgi:adenylate kinase